MFDSAPASADEPTAGAPATACRHDFVRAGRSLDCLIHYECRHCGAEAEKDVS